MKRGIVALLYYLPPISDHYRFIDAFSKFSKERLREIATYNPYVRMGLTWDLEYLLVNQSPFVFKRCYVIANLFEDGPNLSYSKNCLLSILENPKLYCFGKEKMLKVKYYNQNIFKY